MANIPWTLRAAFAVTATGVLLSGCSSSGSDTAATPEVTVTETQAAPTTEAASGFTLPQAPAGAKELNTKTTSSMVYGHYEISGTSPEDVVDGYESALKADGYSITNAGGSGGGWGKWGGSGYGMDAEKDGSYASVQAGGSTSGPTYFEVCVGADESVVDECGEHSEKQNSDSNSSGS